MCGSVSIHYRTFLFFFISFHSFVDSTVDKSSCTFSHGSSVFLNDGTLLRSDTDFDFNETVIVFFIGSTASFGSLNRVFSLSGKISGS